MLTALRWTDRGLEMLDQRLLPHSEDILTLKTAAEVAEAIRGMAVRGAPAIGIAAAYGIALAARNGDDLAQADAVLRSSRPTAVNLSWALDRLRPLWNQGAIRLLAEATAIEAEDLEMNRMIGFHGSALIPKGAGILTICNTGSLATAGHGTALGIIRSAFAQDPTIHVYSCETRPRQQGLRITAYELLQEAIPFHSIADGAAAFLMAKGKVQVVVVGADRIAANGDTANKIGTYMLAVVAAHHRIPFLVAAPSSTIDASLSDGHAIPIEERDAEELTHVEGVQVAPAGCPVWNPAFDLTPGSLINAIVTESGVNRPPYSFVDS